MSSFHGALIHAPFEQEFEKELAWRGIVPLGREGDLVLLPAESPPIAWAAANWREIKTLSIKSINDAAKQLKPLARIWSHCSFSHHRRGSLIEEQLRHIRARALSFPPEKIPKADGAFLLTSSETILYSTQIDRNFASGVLLFQEDKNAPSRAYLKLWEAFTILGRWPLPGQKCLELGASPGGWTWVVARLGASITAVDRSPLREDVAAMPGVEFRAGDAFGFGKEFGPVDWLLSDLICYPQKLLEFVRRWVDSGMAKNYVCTIKFQGPPDPKVIAEFEKLGRVLHLHHNKHELTFLRTEGA